MLWVMCLPVREELTCSTHAFPVEPSYRGVKSLFSWRFSPCCFIKLEARGWNVSSLFPPSYPQGSEQGHSP